MNAEITYVGPLHGLHLDVSDPYVLVLTVARARAQRPWDETPAWVPVGDRFAVLLRSPLSPRGTAMVFDRGELAGFIGLGRQLLPAELVAPLREALGAACAAAGVPQ